MLLLPVGPDLHLYIMLFCLELVGLKHVRTVCRALLVQLGFYMHMQHVIGSMHYVVSLPLVFAMSFMLLFSIVIALFKDIPDIRGDSQVNGQCLLHANRCSVLCPGLQAEHKVRQCHGLRVPDLVLRSESDRASVPAPAARAPALFRHSSQCRQHTKAQDLSRCSGPAGRNEDLQRALWSAPSLLAVHCSA